MLYIKDNPVVHFTIGLTPNSKCIFVLRQHPHANSKGFEVNAQHASYKFHPTAPSKCKLKYFNAADWLFDLKRLRFYTL